MFVLKDVVAARFASVIRYQRVCVLFGSAFLAACATAPPPVTTARPVVSTPRIVPLPASMTFTGGAPFNIARTSSIVAPDGEPRQIAEMLAGILRVSTGFPLTIGATPAAGTSGNISLELVSDRSALGEEGYELTASANGLRIVANRPAGLFRGVQTLRQMLPVAIESEMGSDKYDWSIPAVTIVDQPRFAWRGVMLDVARHFFTVKEVQQLIDIMALYKLNTLHLHLADDQGWRIAIDSRPLLASVGGSTQVGGGEGGFYTKQDYQSIIRYAQARYITVVPEIDMPSHINAALVGYPDLGCSVRPTALFTGTDVGWSALCVDKEETYGLVDDIIREIAAITPGPYFHIGGDEVHSLKKEQYIRFVERVQGIVSKYGKTMVGWEEITQARIAPNTLAQMWKSDSVANALAQGTRLIMSPSQKAYLDMKYTDATELGLKWAGLVEVRTTYDWDPATLMKGLTEANVVGVEGPLWSETVQNITAAQYLLMPRLPALAEVGWTPQARRSWEDFRTRIASHAPRWHLLGINYYRSPQIPW